MDSLANYGSDDDYEETGSEKMGTSGPGGIRTQSPEADVNYDEVQMDLSEESNNNNSTEDDDHRVEKPSEKKRSNRSRSREDPRSSRSTESRSKHRRDPEDRNRKEEDKERPRKYESRSKHDKDSTSDDRHERKYSRDDRNGKIRDDKRRKRSLSRDKKRSISKDRRTSPNKDRKRSISRDRPRRSGSKERRRSYSKERRRSHSKEKIRSHSKEKRRSHSKERKRSHSKERRRSDSKERRRSRSPRRDDRRRRSNSKDRDNRIGNNRYGKRFDRTSSKIAQLEKLGIEIKTPDAEFVTPQMLLQRSMDEQVQKVKNSTGIELPKYYNPAAMNPARYADQIQKRRLLWQKKETPLPGVAPAKEINKPLGLGKVWEQTTFAQDSDGKVASKFKRLMGIKDNAGCSTKDGSKDILKKQEEMFSSMEQQYEVARTATHTMRGVGLGFGTFNNYPR